MDILAENCGRIEGNGAPLTSAKNDAAETCLQHDPATSQDSQRRTEMDLVNHTTPLPIGNLNTTAYKPRSEQQIIAEKPIVLWRGNFRIALIHFRIVPMVLIGCWNEIDGFHVSKLVSPDELTPVGLAVL